MNEEEKEVHNYLQQIFIENDLELLSSIQKKKKKRHKKKYKLDIDINMKDTLFKQSTKTDPIKESKDKEKQRKLELIKKQLKNVPFDKKFRKSDINRIVKHTKTSIFDSEKCCLWTGYVTNMYESKKGTYINFYFKNKKKVALHRLLYINFKGVLNNTDYIKYSCDNKGRCCNINHMSCFEYKSDEIIEENKSEKKTKSKKKNKKEKFIDDNSFTISLF